MKLIYIAFMFLLIITAHSSVTNFSNQLQAKAPISGLQTSYFDLLSTSSERLTVNNSRYS